MKDLRVVAERFLEWLGWRPTCRTCGSRMCRHAYYGWECPLCFWRLVYARALLAYDRPEFDPELALTSLPPESGATGQ